jgi:hypothetical protein
MAAIFAGRSSFLFRSNMRSSKNLLDRFEKDKSEKENSSQFEGAGPPSAQGHTAIHHLPTDICADALLGKVPRDEKILRIDIFERLTSKYEWKATRMILTAGILYMTRPDEDIVRDLIPLSEVVCLKRMHDSAEDDAEDDNVLAQSGVMRNVQLTSLLDGSAQRAHTFQLQTIEDGFNSGRTYYFAAQSEEVCAVWEAAIHTTAGRAARRKQAGPNILARLRLHLRRHHPAPTPAPSPPGSLARDAAGTARGPALRRPGSA